MHLENAAGRITFDYKYDLNLEESELYLPSFYEDSVIELKMVESFQKNGGKAIMQSFLDLPVVRDTKALFLDCCPLFLEGCESTIMKRLHDFYANFGFISITTCGYRRMWRIQQLPSTFAECFESGFEEANDLHPILKPMFKDARHSI